MDNVNTDSKRERYYFYNTLSILLKAVEKQKTTIDLRNEMYIFGTVIHSDAYMNVVMKDCVFTDPRGDSFKCDMFFVQARNIRCIHIPPHIRIMPAIEKQLKRYRNSSRKEKDTTVTFKQIRTQQKQQESRAAVEKILKSRSEKKHYK